MFLIQDSPAVFYRNLQRPRDITLPQNTGRRNPSAWFHCPLSYPRFSGLPSPSSPCASIRTHAYLPSPTESHKAHPEASNCTSLPSWKTPYSTHAHQPPDPSLPLPVGGLRGCGDKRCLECAVLSSAGKGEGGGPWETGNGRRSQLTALDIIR